MLFCEEEYDTLGWQARMGSVTRGNQRSSLHMLCCTWKAQAYHEIAKVDNVEYQGRTSRGIDELGVARKDKGRSSSALGSASALDQDLGCQCKLANGLMIGLPMTNGTGPLLVGYWHQLG